MMIENCRNDRMSVSGARVRHHLSRIARVAWPATLHASFMNTVGPVQYGVVTLRDDDDHDDDGRLAQYRRRC
jgi:hypothetical protein